MRFRKFEKFPKSWPCIKPDDARYIYPHIVLYRSKDETHDKRTRVCDPKHTQLKLKIVELKKIMFENLSGKWIFYPWSYNSGMDHLIHPDDLSNLIGRGVTGIGPVLCLLEEEPFLRIQSKSTIVRVKKEGVKFTLPSPGYTWEQPINIKNHEGAQASIAEICWHHKNKRFYYYLEINGKVGTRRYEETDLEPATV